MEDLTDIDSIAPAGGGRDEDRETVSKDDISGRPLKLLRMRGPHKTKYGMQHFFDATAIDTGDEISFAGGTVLDDQGQRVKDAGAYPVVARLTKRKGDANDFWVFESPDGTATRPDDDVPIEAYE